MVSPCRHAVGGCAQSSSSKDTQSEAEGHQGRIPFAGHWLLRITKVTMSKEASNKNKQLSHLLSVRVTISKVPHRLTPAVAVLDPIQVEHAEGGVGDTRGPVVVVLINVQVESRIAVHVVGAQARPQSLLNGLISQPLLQLGRSTNIVNDALFENINKTTSG